MGTAQSWHAIRLQGKSDRLHLRVTSTFGTDYAESTQTGLLRRRAAPSKLARAVFPSVKPARAVYATKGLQVTRSQAFKSVSCIWANICGSQGTGTDLGVDALTAILALFRVLDDGVVRDHLIQMSQAIESEADHDKGHDLIDEQLGLCQRCRITAAQEENLLRTPEPQRHRLVRYVGLYTP
jgi:hypothetical protein